MGWQLEQTTEGGAASSFSLKNHQWYHLLERGGDKLSVVPANDPDNHVAVGCIFTGSWGVKLQAGTSDLCVKPAHPEMHIVEPYSEEYVLKHAEKNGCFESMILRNSDGIFLPKMQKAILTVTWTPSEILVNSSENVNAEANAEVPESDEDTHEKALQDETTRETSVETEDEDLDRTIGPTDADIESRHVDLEVRNTPAPSVPRTQIVQETPTADRTTNISMPHDQRQMNAQVTIEEIEAEAPATTSQPKPQLEPEEAPVNGHLAHDEVLPNTTDAVGTNNTIASVPVHQNKRPSPMADEELSNASMPISRKRQKTMPDVSTESIPDRSGKRGKKKLEDHEKISQASTPAPPTRRGRKPMGEDQMSRASTASDNAVHTKPTTKRKSRASLEVEESETEDTEIDQDVVYTGPKPRVAFSNSTIADNSMFIKFLRNNGGKAVESIKNGFNILCVRDGPLRKSMKLLSSIALGIPVVTDKWLTDSAQAGVLLPLQRYIPSVPEQEEEWNFSMQEVWSIAQSDLFDGKIIYFTPALRVTYESFAEAEQICKAAGARRIVSKPGKEVQGKDAKDTIILAIEQDDEDALVLAEKGVACYSKDLLTLSILRGNVDLDSDEFKLKPVSSQGKKSKGRGRPRKS